MTRSSNKYDSERTRVVGLMLSVRYYCRMIKTNKDYRLRLLSDKKYFHEIEKKMLSAIDQLKVIDSNVNVYNISNDFKYEVMPYVSTFIEFANAKYNSLNNVALEKEKKLELILKQSEGKITKTSVSYASAYERRQDSKIKNQIKIKEEKERRRKIFEEHNRKYKRILDMQMENKKNSEEFFRIIRETGKNPYLEKCTDKPKRKKLSFKINFIK